MFSSFFFSPRWCCCFFLFVFFRFTRTSTKSFSEYLGIGGGNSTPASRSTKSTPRSGSGGSFCNGTGVASSATAAHGGGGGGGSGGGGATRKWESTGKKRSSGGGSAAGKGPGEAVGQGSGFVRDFIRGAGIHRLDPRRLAGKQRWRRGGRGGAT